MVVELFMVAFKGYRDPIIDNNPIFDRHTPTLYWGSEYPIQLI